MPNIAISVDVYCDWKDEPPRYIRDILCDYPPRREPPRYRVYIDDYLLTERAYIWDNKELYVREHIVVELPNGKHYVKIQPVKPKYPGFSIKNLTVNGEPVTSSGWRIRWGVSPAGEFILD